MDRDCRGMDRNCRKIDLIRGSHSIPLQFLSSPLGTTRFLTMFLLEIPRSDNQLSYKTLRATLKRMRNANMAIIVHNSY